MRFYPTNSQQYIRLQNCFLENCGKDGIQISRSSYVLVERCYVKRLGKLTAGDPDYHGQTVQLFYGGDDIIFRWNTWEANEGQGLIQIAGIGSTTERVRFYGNLIFVKYGHTGDTPGFNTSGGVFGSAWDYENVNDVYVYNNTLVNIGGDYGGYSRFRILSGGSARHCYNNLIYNCEGMSNSGWTTYSYHASGGGDAAGGANEQTGLASSIFSDYTGDDFHLAAATDAGITLTGQGWWDESDAFFGFLDSDADMDGNVRGNDGNWDRGAFEYVSAPPVADAGPDQTLNDTDANGFEIVTLDGTGSSTPSGTITGYLWTNGGSYVGTSPVQITVLPLGVHTITLQVTASTGPTDTDTAVITVVAGGPRPGDADLDGDVDLDDFVILKQNFGRDDATWADGDFDGDGDVDLDDFVFLKQNFGTDR